MGDTAAALAESNIVAMRCSNSSGRHGFWINCKERLIFEVVVQRVGAVVAAKQYGDFWLDTGYQFAGFGAARDRNRHVHQYEADLPGLFLEELDGLSSVGSGQHLIAGFAKDFLGEGAHASSSSTIKLLPAASGGLGGATSFGSAAVSFPVAGR